MTVIQTILLKYLTLGYDRIVISYHGGGDSGAIEEISGFTSTKEALNEAAIDQDDYAYLEHYFYDYLSDQINGDWVNSDGGSGSCTINTSTGQYELNTELYFTDSVKDSCSGSLIDIDEKEE